MKIFTRTILVAAITAILLFAVAVWQLPAKVEMAEYVPFETLVYLEVNDLPAAWRAVSDTEAWRELAPVYQIDPNLSTFGRFSRALAQINLGSTETIVAGRAQIAVALTGVGTRDQNDDSLRVKPQFAVVIETKSSRAQSFVENPVQDFARRQFGEIRVERKTVETANYTIFRSIADERDLFAAVDNTLVVLGNDEAAVQACLDARRKTRKSLIENEQLTKMRSSLATEKPFAFGLVTSEGVKQLSKIAAVFAAGQFAEDPRALALLAQSLPAFLQKTVTAIGWTTNAHAGKIEDRFLIEMPQDLTANLREPLAAAEAENAGNMAAMLPANADSITVYNFKNAQSAWRGAALALSTKLDVLSAAIFSQTVGGLLKPYGVEKGDEFLGLTTGEILTARFENAENQNAENQDAENRSLAAVRARDANLLSKTLQLDENHKSDFVGDLVLLGNKEHLSAARQARDQHKTFDKLPVWQNFSREKLGATICFARTLTKDRKTPEKFVRLFAKNKAIEHQPSADLPAWVWATSETRLVREGLERRTVSAFGFVGTLATSFGEN